MELNKLEFPQHDRKEEVQADQQLWNQERNSFVKQDEPEPPWIKEEREEREPSQIKEEQGELCIGQEGELLVVKMEDETFMVPPVYEENSHSEVKPNNDPQLHDYKKEEVLNIQQLHNKEMNCSLDQEEQDATHIKEEELVEDEHELKQETDSFMDSPTYEENDHSGGTGRTLLFEGERDHLVPAASEVLIESNLFLS
ncbi:uncharacterized protein KZ484_017919 [Pholidichthys leucotaenia]